MNKTWKKSIKNLTLAFSLVASPALISPPSALANHPGSHNPIGLWQAVEHNMIAEVEKCPDDSVAVCATVYRTTEESVDTAIKKEKERRQSGKEPENYGGKPSTYCEIFEKTRARESKKDDWESDDISMFIFSAKLGMTLQDDNTAKGQANVRLKLFNAGVTDINVTAKRIPSDGPEFKACREMKAQGRNRTYEPSVDSY